MSFTYLFQQIGFFVLLFNSSVSTFVMEMFAKAQQPLFPLLSHVFQGNFFH